MRPVIMGTAGHIDHGKTTLVKALTGIDCDRLVEEKKRGITIELGFAFLDLDGQRLSIVDVPGHEKFVKNMVAGATGIDFVLLVVAADEGVMPQTREHLEICQLLGISGGLVALTKCDMVDEDWLALATEDVAGFLQGTFLENAPIFPVSAHTGQGLPELKAALAAQVAAFAPTRRPDLVRLPIDRIFTMKGHGTVVTGTLIAGHLALGEDVMLYPSGKTSKIRSLQSHGAPTELAPAGRRTAVNLAGLEVADIHRGDVLGRPGQLVPHLAWDVALTCLSSSPKALKHRLEVHFHHGARETQARIHLFDRDRLAPGEGCVCQIRFEEPMVGVHGDRFVIRSFAPLRTVAGGRVLNPLPRPRTFKVRRFNEADLQRLDPLLAGDAEGLVATQLAMAGVLGRNLAELKVGTNLDTKQLDAVLQAMSGRQAALLFDKEERRYVAGETLQQLAAATLAFVKAFHAREPMKLGLSRGALSAAWPAATPPRLGHLVVERLLKQKDLETEGDVLKLAGHTVSMASDVAGFSQTLLEAYVAGGLTPPNLKDVLEPLAVTPKQAQPVLALLQEQGTLVKVKEDMYFHAPALAELVTRVRAWFQDPDSPREEMGPDNFRELTGLTRKYLIPLLEWLDKEKITVRVGDKRRLRRQ
ncbi:MAG: selenocysteine-specific translation elongation factor [Desulfovibrio sp.]|nr:selenocysteine-specific translation elongation factor [Desulfovibrio sp.]